jgi:hypothetical protein
LSSLHISNMCNRQLRKEWTDIRPSNRDKTWRRTETGKSISSDERIAVVKIFQNWRDKSSDNLTTIWER